MSNEARKFDSAEFITRDEFSQFKEEISKLGLVKNEGQLERLSIVAFSGSLDKLIAAFIMATGAAASGMEVKLFFTFWGTSALKSNEKQPPKGFLERMFGWMLPRGSEKLPLSQMNMGGAGPKMIRHMMSKKNVSSLEELIQLAGDLDVQISVCEMSMDLMGIHAKELRSYPNLEFCGVTKFLDYASHGKMTLFI